MYIYIYTCVYIYIGIYIHVFIQFVDAHAHADELSDASWLFGLVKEATASGGCPPDRLSPRKLVLTLRSYVKYMLFPWSRSKNRKS